MKGQATHHALDPKHSPLYPWLSIRVVILDGLHELTKAPITVCFHLQHHGLTQLFDPPRINGTREVFSEEDCEKRGRKVVHALRVDGRVMRWVYFRSAQVKTSPR